MKYFYKKMDIIILPSLNEAFGLVFIEALALGTRTLVSTRFGAIDYIKEPIKFMTFNPNKPVELSKKIKTFIERPLLKEKFSNLYFKYFELDDIVEKFLKGVSK